ncbi:hypothetical protein [Caloramator proteoclasticus]|uniref:Uncharacterized protein n=1 Tax=Caloramator proteoclasticus DSM 10124 TaxID=1121262 RepID=A0A1M5A027_9CLOT|nr:hypothetical protein [Caloramator proteoclasticus]SHF23564.1 hypothetical protein SAMN02746091_02057 [Caloramator proteoclasticus DSM 10124]
MDTKKILDKKNNIYGFLMIILIILFLPGCSSKSTKIDNNYFIAVKYKDHSNANAEVINAVNNKKDEIKIGRYLSDNTIEYIPEIDTILFVDQNGKLFAKKPQSEAVEIKNNINYFRVLGIYKNFLLLANCALDTAVADIYLINMENWEAEKLISNAVLDLKYSKDFSVIVYDDWQDIKIYKKGQEAKKITNSLYDGGRFDLSPNGKILVYCDGKGTYVYNVENDEKEKISSKKYEQVTFINEDTLLFVMENELYEMKVGKEPEKIISNINDYKYSSKGIYFTDEDKNLYFLKDKQKNKIASEVKEYFVNEDGSMILFINDEDILYRVENLGDKQKISSDLEKYSFNGERFVGLNKDNELYVIEKGKDAVKIDTDVNNFELPTNTNNVAYIKDNSEMYLLKNIKSKPQKVIDNLKDYNFIKYGELILYEKQLELNDVEGIWRFNVETQNIDPKFASAFIKINGDTLELYAFDKILFKASVLLDAHNSEEGKIVFISKQVYDFSDLPYKYYYAALDLIDYFSNGIEIKFDGKSIEDDNYNAYERVEEIYFDKNNN